MKADSCSYPLKKYMKCYQTLIYTAKWIPPLCSGGGGLRCRSAPLCHGLCTERWGQIGQPGKEQGDVWGKCNTQLFLPMFFLPSPPESKDSSGRKAGGCGRLGTRQKERWEARSAASSCSKLLSWPSKRMSKFNFCVNNRGREPCL